MSTVIYSTCRNSHLIHLTLHSPNHLQRGGKRKSELNINWMNGHAYTSELYYYTILHSPSWLTRLLLPPDPPNRLVSPVSMSVGYKILAIIKTANIWHHTLSRRKKLHFFSLLHWWELIGRSPETVEQWNLSFLYRVYRHLLTRLWRLMMWQYKNISSMWESTQVQGI